MFEALRRRLQSLQEAPRRARDLAARRLTARCRMGHVDATADGLRVVVNVRKPFLSRAWRAEIAMAIAEAMEGK